MYELIHGGSALIQLNRFVGNSLTVETNSFEVIEDRFRYKVNFHYIAYNMSLSKSEEVSPELYNQHRYGVGTLTIYYDRNQPSNAIVDLGRLYGLGRDEVLFGGGALIFCVVMCSFWYWMAFGKRWSG